MAVTSYSTLTSAIGEWATRTYTSSQTDEFIALAEAEFNLILGGYRRETSVSITTTSGVGSLPADFLDMVSLTHATYGLMLPIAWSEIALRNPTYTGGTPTHYAISGSSLKLDYSFDGSFTATYAQKLTGLSADNTTNWLLALAPQAYLFMCIAMQRAFEEEFATSQGFEAKARAIIDEVVLQATVAQYGNARMALPVGSPVP
jgi:hypothetical protein